MKICSNLLNDYKLKKIINIGNINIYLLKTNCNKNNLDLGLLKDLIEINKASVKEINDNGRIDRVLVANDSDKDLLLISGDILEGAKQNRMIMENIIINKKSKVEVPVSCVERNRWNYYENKNFHVSDIKISPKIRSSKDELIKNKYTESIQSKIWDDIEKISLKSNIRYFSSNYCDIKDLHSDLDYDNAKNIIENTNFNAYFVEGVGNVFFEYFYNNKLAKSSLVKSIPSYLCDQDGSNLYNVKILDLNLIKDSKWIEFSNIGLGKSYTTNERNLGKAILYMEEVAHLYFYFK